MKNKIPENIAEWVGIFIGVATVLARLKKQPELHDVNQFVTVTAGHSNADPGAVNGKYKEAELVRQFRNAVAHSILQPQALSYKTDGAGTINLHLQMLSRWQKAHQLAIEFHMNASANSQANGIETIALPKDKLLAAKVIQSRG